jgi:hypothetical protein
MSNIALFSGSNVPAFVKKAELSSLTKALAGGGGAQGKRISIKGGVFRLMVDGKEVAAIEERYLDVVLVAAAPKVSRTFYMKSYDSENPAGPDCWSADGETPDKSAASPQSDRCATCPQNVKGSGQGDSRACRFNQRLAVVLVNDIEGDVMQLQLPAASIFGKAEGENMPLQAYARVMAAQNANVDMVVTRLKFDTKSESPKLFFKPMRWLTEDEYATAQEKGQSPDAQAAITMTVAQMDKVPTPTLEGKRPTPATKPAPAAQEEEDEPPAPAPKRGRPTKAEAEAKKAAAAAEAEEDTPEPPVKKEAKETVAPKSTLAKLAAEWDDEE